MKKPECWKPTKYEIINGRLIGSSNPKELAICSRLVADMTANFYSRAIPAYVNGRLLDMGCGKAPLYGYYRNYCTEVTLADWPESLHQNQCIDIVCDLNRPLPFKDNEFDTILLSDVLEHLYEPIQLWEEMYRILSPHGKVLLNTPFFYWLHEIPHDYYRYTEHILQYMAESTGFRIIELDSFGGGPVIILDILSKMFSINKKGGRLTQWGIQKIGERLKKASLKKKSRKLFPLGYYMVVEKLED